MYYKHVQNRHRRLSFSPGVVLICMDCVYDYQNAIDMFKLSFEEDHLNHTKHAFGGSHNSTGYIKAVGLNGPALSTK